ncbi:YpiB family protein [Bacillus sp. 165]|uniref:YpiB family protein n=1 Tax=Bacillus sp. 165 TaxID=1529117 RepID=UPI001ADCDA1C|nr:YpiB family protein [Bacillus sp. 165]MBO9128559.1 YpiB family protein [Bacillus sp. 165]
MKKWVSAIAKRNFLQWFLQEHRLKSTDGRRLLEFILNKPHILEHISFTEKLKPNEKTIIISSMNSDQIGFAFHYNQYKTTDISRALSELSSNPSGKVNLILHFYGKMLNHRYLQLIETSVSDNIKQYERYERQSKETDTVITQAMLAKEKEHIKKQIDDALDQRDEQLFKKLVARLHELDKQG